MYREIDKFTNRYDEKALFFSPNLSSLFFFVLLSYYNLSRCSLRIKTLLDCLIQATYYEVSTHRAMTENSTLCTIHKQEDIMRNEYNVRLVKVVMPFPRIIAKGIKYLMLATVTGCAIQSTLILTQLAERVL